MIIRAFLLFALTTPVIAKKYTMGLITPENSSWTTTLRQLSQEVAKATSNRVAIKIFPGSVLGTEFAMISKMRSRLDMAGLTGVGLQQILPEVRIFESPMMFSDHAEVDKVKGQLFSYFEGKFREKGYELLGLVEGGFVYLYSKQKLNDMKVLNSLKMWMLKGDKLGEIFLSSFGISPKPLDLGDVIMGLSTGMIDSFYAPPLVSVSFQWAKKEYVSSMLDFPFALSIGAIVMKNRSFKKMSKLDQASLKSLTKKYSNLLVTRTRLENKTAKEENIKEGLSIEKPSAVDIADFQKKAMISHEKSMPELYEKKLYNRVRGILGKSTM